MCKKAEKTLKDTPENRSRPDFLWLKKTKNQTKVIINAKRALKLYPDPQTKRVYFEIITPKGAEDVGEPTMSSATATCPFCESQQPGDYIKRCGHEGKLKAQMTTVVYQEEYGKEYRPPTPEEMIAAEVPEESLKEVADDIPYGIPDEPMPGSETLGFRIPLYGLNEWSNVFTDRQLLALMEFVKWTHAAQKEMKNVGYPEEWNEVINNYLVCIFDRLLVFNSTQVVWNLNAEGIGHTFARYAFPMTWDFCEGPILGEVRGSYKICIDKILSSVKTISTAHTIGTKNCIILCQSASDPINLKVDTIITDPPYYDAIPYADLSDFFYVWLRRMIGPSLHSLVSEPLSPRIDELVQHTSRFAGDRKESREFYEKGIAASFRSAYQTLSDDGRMVVVFAHKDPAAWETLVKAMIESGLVVTASWPIDTEKRARVRAQGSAALATSLWLVCRKRPTKAKAGHYGKVKSEMQKRITERLRYFWDAGIRGPDFVWSAIGPALESYSSYKEVKRMDGEVFTVTEFLTEVRRIVTDFALGQILHGTSTEALDEWTRYYLMHRDYFGTENAPVGECILLAQGYGVSLDDLSTPQVGILKRAGSGNVRELLGHTERTSDRIGYAHTSGRIPMIDMIHRIMKLWDANESAYINAYFHEHGLQENALFKAVVQALIETSPQGASERSLLETLINYKPGERVSGVSLPGQSTKEDERQLTFEDIPSK